MFHILEKSIAQAVATKVSETFQTDAVVSVEPPKDTSFGEFALPIAFQLARPLRKAPKVIAEELKAQLAGLPGVATLEIAGNGYLNVRLDRAAYLALLTGAPAAPPPPAGKIIVEHTNINPNKAAHIGHLRNSILGDTFVRMLRAAGESVEVQNYIDNTGVQVADVVVGFHYLEKKSLAEVTQLVSQPKFDYYCWDLYARTSSYYRDHAEALAWRAETLHAIESGHGEIAELGHLVADAIVQCHLRTMARLDIAYDVLPRESEILHLKFWAAAFELLKERRAIYFENEGKNKGCWVMPASAFKENPNATDEDGAEDSKVIVRSNGTVTYVGKDIAYQLWKFGLLGKDFHYRPLENWPRVWVSTSDPQPQKAPAFGGARQVYNVIDSRQSYLQDVVVAGLRALGFTDQAGHSIHFSYEMVALSPRTCAELGIPISEEDAKKPYVEVSGRKGLGVKADDLIDKLIESARAEVDSRNADKPEAERLEVATQIAIGALRYFMLKFTRNTVIAFDLQEALAFTGETGPYVQYAAVRARKILAKLPPVDATAVPAAPLADENLWQLLLATSKLDYSLERCVASGEPSHLARYAFQLAQAFSGFYENYPVLHETDPAKQKFLIWMTDYFARQLGRTCGILGIPVPQYM